MSITAKEIAEIIYVGKYCHDWIKDRPSPELIEEIVTHTHVVECIEALEGIKKHLNKGALVRSIELDSQPDWHQRMLRLVVDISRISEALALAKGDKP